jgi:hypothetical protein
MKKQLESRLCAQTHPKLLSARAGEMSIAI